MITERETSTTTQENTKTLLGETIREKTPQNFLSIEFDQVQCKTPATRIVSHLP